MTDHEYEVVLHLLRSLSRQMMWVQITVSSGVAMGLMLLAWR